MLDVIQKYWKLLFFIPLVIILGQIIIQDLTTFKIGNKKLLLIIILFPIYLVFLKPDMPTLSLHLLSAICLLVFGLVFYWLKILGAGDVKLYSVLALWFGPMLSLYHFVISSFIGLALIIIVILFRKIRFKVIEKYIPSLVNLHKRKKVFPYGVPISLTAIIIFIHMLVRDILPL